MRVQNESPPRSQRTARFRLGTLWLAASLLIGGLIAGAWLLAKSNVEAPEISTARAENSVSQSTRIATQSIETLRVGQRIPSRNPDVAESARTSKTQVDPTTWRLLKLRAEWRWEDGTLDVHIVETLQPLAWIKRHNAKVGATVPLALDLVEMGSLADLKATVVSVQPCPPIDDGPGHVILTTVNHLNKFLFRLTVADERGKQAIIGVTGFHKIYSETRRSWVSTKDLRRGEKLGYLNRPVTVTNIQRVPGTHRVYNLTVENEHAYYVSNLAALVHNTGDCHPDFDTARQAAFEHAGMTDPSKVEFSKVDPVTGTITEFKGPGGAKVGYDGPHDSPGPHHDVQHISAQKPGKRTQGEGDRENFPYSGPQHPSRPERK